MSDWQPGKPLENGKYEILRKIGQGGFGVTYLATSKNGQQVVIKTLNLSAIPQNHFDKFRKDFYNEAVRLAKCSNHSNIVEILELIEEDKLPCMVMEYVAGKNLFDKVQDEGILSEAVALHYIRQIGSALQAIHEKNILHRDVKPHNILIRDHQQEAILIDFGIARDFDPTQTAPLTSFESKGYTPFEQLFFASNHKPNAYTDVYGLAASLYYILTGQTPLDAGNRALSVSSSSVDPLTPPQSLNPRISKSVNNAILKGLEIYPDKRPQSIQDWLNLFEDIDYGEASLPTVYEGVMRGSHSESNPVVSGHFPPSAPTVVTGNNGVKASPTVVTGNNEVNVSPTVVTGNNGVKASPKIQNKIKPSRQKPWLLPTILAGGLMLILIPSAVLYLNSKNTGSSQESSTLNQEHSGQGLKITYPSNWKLSTSEPNEFDPTFAVLTPLDSSSSSEKIIFELKTVTQGTTLNTATEKSIQEIKQFLSDAQVSEVEKITLGQNEGEQFTYTGTEDNKSLKRKQVNLLKDNRLYMMTYEAEIEQYSQGESSATKIMESVEILP